MSIGFSEKLSETERRFPCVYDKPTNYLKIRMLIGMFGQKWQKNVFWKLV